MADETLAELLDPQTITEIFSKLLGVYQANGFPVQSWQTGGVERTRLMAISTALSDLSANYIPTIAAGGLLGLAALLENPDWLQLLASENYNVDFNAATYTEGTIRATTTATAGPYIVQSGQLVAVFAASGNRYINTASTTIPNNGFVDINFKAEFAGASYADPSNSGSLTLVSPLPGVTLSNPAGDYTDVAHVGAGTGTITPSGAPVGPHQVTIQIDSTGASGAASWSYSLDGGAFTSAGAVASASNLGGTGVDVTLVDGASGTSFVQDDTYLFNTPGSWIGTQGADEETSAALAERCRNRWSSLSPIPVTNLYELLVTSTPDVGSQVTQVIVVPDAYINNKVNIVVAGPEGALPPATVALIQDYVDPRVPITDRPVVQSPAQISITLAGTITCSSNLLLTVQGAVETAMVNYINSVGINGTIRISKIIELIMEVDGVTDVDSVTINTVAANLTLGSGASFYISDLQPLSFGYITT